MSNIVPTQAKDFTREQVQLIRDTIAPTATDSEFELFLYRCKHMGLDPLKPGQIFFIKYGNGPGTIVVGREGFRVRAAKTGKHTGTKLGTLRNEAGKCVGAWCEAYRSDWQHPARVEVSLSEYNTGKSQWAKMPETMIQKVAEAAALRMAFPDELGGIYLKEEMDQAEETAIKSRDVSPPLANYSVDAPFNKNPGAYKITFGTIYYNKETGQSMTIAEAIDADGQPAFEKWLGILKDNAAAKRFMPPDHQLVIDHYELYKRQIEEELAAESMINDERMGRGRLGDERFDSKGFRG